MLAMLPVPYFSIFISFVAFLFAIVGFQMVVPHVRAREIAVSKKTLRELEEVLEMVQIPDYEGLNLGWDISEFIVGRQRQSIPHAGNKPLSTYWFDYTCGLLNRYSCKTAYGPTLKQDSYTTGQQGVVFYNTSRLRMFKTASSNRVINTIDVGCDRQSRKWEDRTIKVSDLFNFCKGATVIVDFVKGSYTEFQMRFECISNSLSERLCRYVPSCPGGLIKVANNDVSCASEDVVSTALYDKTVSGIVRALDKVNRECVDLTGNQIEANLGTVVKDLQSNFTNEIKKCREQNSRLLALVQNLSDIAENRTETMLSLMMSKFNDTVGVLSRSIIASDLLIQELEAKFNNSEENRTATLRQIKAKEEILQRFTGELEELKTKNIELGRVITDNRESNKKFLDSTVSKLKKLNAYLGFESATGFQPDPTAVDGRMTEMLIQITNALNSSNVSNLPDALRKLNRAKGQLNWVINNRELTQKTADWLTYTTGRKVTILYGNLSCEGNTVPIYGRVCNSIFEEFNRRNQRTLRMMSGVQICDCENVIEEAGMWERVLQYLKQYLLYKEIASRLLNLLASAIMTISWIVDGRSKIGYLTGFIWIPLLFLTNHILITIIVSIGTSLVLSVVFEGVLTIIRIMLLKPANTSYFLDSISFPNGESVPSPFTYSRTNVVAADHIDKEFEDLAIDNHNKKILTHAKMCGEHKMGGWRLRYATKHKKSFYANEIKSISATSETLFSRACKTLCTICLGTKAREEFDSKTVYKSSFACNLRAIQTLVEIGMISSSNYNIGRVLAYLVLMTMVTFALADCPVRELNSIDDFEFGVISLTAPGCVKYADRAGQSVELSVGRRELKCRTTDFYVAPSQSKIVLAQSPRLNACGQTYCLPAEIITRKRANSRPIPDVKCEFREPWFVEPNSGIFGKPLEEFSCRRHPLNLAEHLNDIGMEFDSVLAQTSIPGKMAAFSAVSYDSDDEFIVINNNKNCVEYFEMSISLDSAKGKGTQRFSIPATSKLLTSGDFIIIDMKTNKTFSASSLYVNPKGGPLQYGKLGMVQYPVSVKKGMIDPAYCPTTSDPNKIANLFPADFAYNTVHASQGSKINTRDFSMVIPPRGVEYDIRYDLSLVELPRYVFYGQTGSSIQSIDKSREVEIRMHEKSIGFNVGKYRVALPWLKTIHSETIVRRTEVGCKELDDGSLVLCMNYDRDCDVFDAVSGYSSLSEVCQFMENGKKRFQIESATVKTRHKSCDEEEIKFDVIFKKENIIIPMPVNTFEGWKPTFEELSEEEIIAFYLHGRGDPNNGHILIDCPAGMQIKGNKCGQVVNASVFLNDQSINHSAITYVNKTTEERSNTFVDIVGGIPGVDTIFGDSKLSESEDNNDSSLLSFNFLPKLLRNKAVNAIIWAGILLIIIFFIVRIILSFKLWRLPVWLVKNCFNCSNRPKPRTTNRPNNYTPTIARESWEEEILNSSLLKRHMGKQLKPFEMDAHILYRTEKDREYLIKFSNDFETNCLMNMLISNKINKWEKPYYFFHRLINLDNLNYSESAEAIITLNRELDRIMTPLINFLKEEPIQDWYWTGRKFEVVLDKEEKNKLIDEAEMKRRQTELEGKLQDHIHETVKKLNMIVI